MQIVHRKLFHFTEDLLRSAGTVHTKPHPMRSIDHTKTCAFVPFATALDVSVFIPAVAEWKLHKFVQIIEAYKQIWIAASPVAKPHPRCCTTGIHAVWSLDTFWLSYTCGFNLQSVIRKRSSYELFSAATRRRHNIPFPWTRGCVVAQLIKLDSIKRDTMMVVDAQLNVTSRRSTIEGVGTQRGMGRVVNALKSE